MGLTLAVNLDKGLVTSGCNGENRTGLVVIRDGLVHTAHKEQVAAAL